MISQKVHTVCPNCGKEYEVTKENIRRKDHTGLCHGCGRRKSREYYLSKFKNLIDTNDVGGCWTWKGTIGIQGYGHFHLGIILGGPKTVDAYQFSYELAKGPVPPGLELDHVCRNKRCVNPDHLEPVTHKENGRRGLNGPLLKTHCVHGHLYDAANTGIAKGRRFCRICSRLAVKRYQQRKESSNEPHV